MLITQWFYQKVKLLLKGTPQELIKNTKAIEAYFGEGFKYLILKNEKSNKNLKHN